MELETFDLGLVDYKRALDFQGEVFKAVKLGELAGALIFCRHYPVITLGRGATRSNVLVSGEELKRKGVVVYEIERGGDVTYHGPGQLVIYPVVNLSRYKKDIHWFLRQLEAMAIDLLSGFKVGAERISGKTGVWVGVEKIASIGIAIRRWITFHGLSINIKGDDLDNFSLIRPCGMDIKMTSLETVLGESVEMDDIMNRCKRAEIFKLNGG